jgi:hypothetical protein
VDQEPQWRRRSQRTVVKVPGKENEVTAVMMRMLVLSCRVNNATFFESSAIAFIAALSCELALCNLLRSVSYLTV